MIPIFWRYLLRSYFKVFFLSLATFASILIISRFKEIARFAALCGQGPKICLFILYQLPYILPLAIPISALLSSLLLFQGLSRSHELTAFRTASLSIRTLLFPMLFAATLLSFAHFSICFSVAPYCGREAKAILYRETSANPLVLMQRQNLIKIKDAYLNMSVKKEGKIAEDLLLITHSETNHRLNLFSAKNLQICGQMLHGHGVAFLAHLPSEEKEMFEPLFIENQTAMSTEAPILSTSLKKHRPKVDPNGLSLKMLYLRSLEPGKHGKAAWVEILRKVSLSLAVVTFTLLGAAFGMQEGRTFSKKGSLVVFLFTLIFLMSYLGLKELKNHLFLSYLAALLPHLSILLACCYRLRNLSRGRG